jgi:peptidoglycan/LPS O-acetylase OafA/YrhL
VTNCTGGAWSFATLFLFALAVLVFSFDAGAVSRVLQMKTLQSLGLLSYSIYMIHGFVVMRFANVMEYAGPYFGVTKRLNAANGNTYSIPYIPGELLSLVFAARVIYLSSLTDRFIEVPGRDFVRRWLDSRTKRVASA